MLSALLNKTFPSFLGVKHTVAQIYSVLILFTLNRMNVFDDACERIQTSFVCQLINKSWALGCNCQLTDGNTLCLVIAVIGVFNTPMSCMLNMLTSFQDRMQTTRRA